MNQQEINIPKIILEWSEWYSWKEFLLDARKIESAVKVPNKKGVYEVINETNNEMLTIGKAGNLRMRVKQGLVKGKVAHSSGKKINISEDTAHIKIRWAITDRPSAVEEELHQQFIKIHKKLPKYTEHT
ncbi:MAG: hypothetical protein KKA84_16255 [Bacteroidetes bacterium]|nr:hypothetical protein [Bacteroidota bacterium]